MDYFIAPKASFDATADAIRVLNGTNSDITWRQDGFADAISELGASILDRTISGTYTHNTLTKVGKYAFSNCINLTAINFPEVTKIDEYAFNAAGITTLQTAQCPKLTNIAQYAFTSSSISSVDHSAVTTVGIRVFRYCRSLQNVNLPNLTALSNELFQGCTSLETFNNNVLFYSGQIPLAAFGTTNISYMDLVNASSIGASVFGDDPLITLILRKADNIVTLANVNAFSKTPFASGGTGGTIYIPKVFYDQLGTGTNDYKSATNWSTIDGYGTITWAQIEGSYYETHYADGTPIGGAS